jgi:hypothetical protein
MKSIEARFNKFIEEDPGYSDYLAFSMAVGGQKFSRKLVMEWFNKLVSKEDYDSRDKKEIIEGLMEHTNDTEEG